MDLLAAIDGEIELSRSTGKIVPTGISIALPAGFEAQVRPRSGLAAKNGITVANAPGTIDADYRGEVGVILVNLGAEPFRSPAACELHSLSWRGMPGRSGGRFPSSTRRPGAPADSDPPA